MEATVMDGLLAARKSRYGDFADQAALSQALKLDMAAHPKYAALEPAMREALEMVQHKVGRIINGDPFYQDSWVDIIGYSQLVLDILREDESGGKKATFRNLEDVKEARRVAVDGDRPGWMP